MTYETLIAVDALKDMLASGSSVLIFDCEFDLGKPDVGARIYAQGHIPGARHAHLDDDLSSPPDETSGRHPLPARVALVAWLRSQGLRSGQQIVAYDSSGGAWAARLWWLMRWLGHAPVAVLDGGKQAWVTAGLPLEAGYAPPVASGDFEPAASLVPDPVNAAAVLRNIDSAEAQLLDARDPSRFAGEPNPIDPVAGHIPGARNRFFRDNLDAHGNFRAPDDLAAAFTALLAGKPAILQCGSGVTACHNALAMEIAGLPAGRLYPGSWSEWIKNPARSVETGPARE